jgi:hypothetical protein
MRYQIPRISAGVQYTWNDEVKSREGWEKDMVSNNYHYTPFLNS